MNSDDSSPLLDSHGNPIQKPKSERESLEALIRSELLDTKERLREANKEELQQIAEKYYAPKVKFWHRTNAYTLALLAAIILFGWFKVPDIIRTKTESYFRENLVGTALTNTVNNIVNNDATVIIQTQLKPIKANIVALEGRTETLDSDISNQQTQFNSAQVAIQKQILPMTNELTLLQTSLHKANNEADKLQEEQKLMALMNRGEVFNRDAIQQLEIISQGTNEIASLAQAMAWRDFSSHWPGAWERLCFSFVRMFLRTLKL